MCHLDTKIELAKIELTEDREVEAEERIGKIGDQMDGGQTLVRQNSNHPNFGTQILDLSVKYPIFQSGFQGPCHKFKVVHGKKHSRNELAVSF